MATLALAAMVISGAQRGELIEHAREEAPNECCGYMKLRDGVVEEIFRAENTYHAPTRFNLDGKSLLAANHLDDEGFGVAIYHSHPRSPAEPSQTDINIAFYPHWLYLIVSLDGDEPEVRAWRITDGQVNEEALEIAD
jgi:[CysO sulfur-carrier protein]-S-L-cysteine hydrolase